MRTRIAANLLIRLSRLMGRWNTSARLPARTAGIVIWMSWRRSINRTSKWLSLHAHRHPASRLSRSTRGILDMMAGGIATHVPLEKSYLTVGLSRRNEGRFIEPRGLFA